LQLQYQPVSQAFRAVIGDIQYFRHEYSLEMIGGPRRLRHVIPPLGSHPRDGGLVRTTRYTDKVLAER